MQYSVRMRVPNQWIAVDLLGPSGRNMLVHSAGGAKVAKALRRVDASELGFDETSRRIFTAYADSLRSDTDTAIDLPDDLGNLRIEHHLLTAADGKNITAIIWFGDTEPTPRPTYNAWVADLFNFTTATTGDDVKLIGDDREEGEERHGQHLFRYLNPEDAWRMMGGYYDAFTGDDGLYVDANWTLNVPDNPVHFYSGCRLVVTDTTRLLYGTSMQIAARPDYQSNIATLVGGGDRTLLLFEARGPQPLTSVGAEAPVSPEFYESVMKQVDLKSPGQAEITVEGKEFTAMLFPLHSVQEQHGDPVAILLTAK
jgi:hypothetical protein